MSAVVIVRISIEKIPSQTECPLQQFQPKSPPPILTVFKYNHASTFAYGIVLMFSQNEKSICDVAELDAFLSEPHERTLRSLAALSGDILILGVGGKMGPTLARMARRASDAAGSSRRVIGVSRFSSPALSPQLQSWGVETLSCDLMNRQALAALPDAANVVFMAGMKFGSTGQESLTWAMNSFLPGMVSERFPTSRIAVFSTGNVYGLSPVSEGGSREEDEIGRAS